MSRAATILIALMSATSLHERRPTIEAAPSAVPAMVTGAREPPGAVPVAGCETASNELLSRATVDGAATREEQEQILHVVGQVEHEGPRCVTDLVEKLARGPACTSTAGFITAGFALDGALAPDVVDHVLASRPSCTTAIVTAVGETPRPTRELVDVIERWDRAQRDPMVRSGGLVVLGSLAHHARENDDSSLADGIDSLLARELRRPASSEAERVQRLEAVGNAGCAPCARAITAALREPSADVRRAAVGALRFVEGERSVDAMCDELDDEASAEVRDQAAWALSWGRSSPTERVHCLARAAARDTSPVVRICAARSLAGLAHDVPMARDALLQLTDPQYDERVRDLALSMVDAFPPEPERTGVVAVHE